jgi:AraC-like DNA-binding protein
VASKLGAVDRVKQYLLARPPARIPDLLTAARDLGLSGRSLRRLLASEATSYRSLIRNVLQTTAEHMLRDPARSIQETAGALGFTNVRAFYRAFKQWSGMTPGEYRRRRGDDR